MTDVGARKKALLARLQELDGRVHEIEDELVHHNNPDWEDRAVERETDEVLESMGLSAQHEMKAIQFALQRIEDGEYGFCQSCGEKVSEERLDVVPYTPFCKNCASKVN
jgi:RNA polymerase-binding transcription factor DksA